MRLVIKVQSSSRNRIQSDLQLKQIKKVSSHTFMWHLKPADITWQYATRTWTRKQVHRKTVIISLKEPKKNEKYFSHSKRTLVILTFAQTPSCSSLPVFVWSAILDHVCCPRFVTQRYLLDCSFQTKWRATRAEKRSKFYWQQKRSCTLKS